jgi:hypothetical protein
MSAPGPFTVTQHRKCCTGCTVPRAHPPVYREAFATLGDALLIAESLVDHRDDWREMRERVATLSANGGKITLPNGDLIEVEAKGELWRDAPSPCGPWDSVEEQCAAWNAEYGTGIGVRA